VFFGSNHKNGIFLGIPFLLSQRPVDCKMQSGEKKFFIFVCFFKTTVTADASIMLSYGRKIEK